MTREQWRELAVDAMMGLAIAVLVILVVVFSSAAEPSFIYQAF